jgi:hypothetical protein
MKARDIFGIIVRAVGLGFMVMALFNLYYVFAKLMGLPIVPRYPISVDLSSAGFYVVISLVFLFGAKVIVRLIYGSELPSD